MWQTRTLATFVAATVPVENKGDVSSLMEAAQQIGVSDAETSTEDRDRRVEPAAGSYERFMSSFGSPARWGGR